MYQNNFRPQRGFRFSNRRFSGGKRAGFRQKINESMYVRPAGEIKKIEDVVTVHNFDDFGFRPQLINAIRAKGYTKPTPIQDQIIAPIMEGRDVLGIAATGTGKTAAFALPIIQMLLDNPSQKTIILAPTRELAMQIKQEFRSFSAGLPVYVALAIGGAFIREQIVDIKRGAQIIVGTPGRIQDLAKRRAFHFGSFSRVVLDEVDRMLDMGFVDEIRGIMDQIPQSRQTLFFSATANGKVASLIDTILHDPIKVSIQGKEASDHVEQNVVRCKQETKKETLAELLKSEELKKVLIFGETKRMVEELSTWLYQTGFSADSIHGDKPQNKRARVLKLFKENQIKILVATDVAARGLDIADITHVINYSQPNNYDDYIHRIGRTGRGNAKGYALTFVEDRPAFGQGYKGRGGWGQKRQVFNRRYRPAFRNQ